MPHLDDNQAIAILSITTELQKDVAVMSSTLERLEANQADISEKVEALMQRDQGGKFFRENVRYIATVIGIVTALVTGLWGIFRYIERNEEQRVILQLTPEQVQTLQSREH